MLAIGFMSYSQDTYVTNNYYTDDDELTYELRLQLFHHNGYYASYYQFAWFEFMVYDWNSYYDYYYYHPHYYSYQHHQHHDWDDNHNNYVKPHNYQHRGPTYSNSGRTIQYSKPSRVSPNYSRPSYNQYNNSAPVYSKPTYSSGHRGSTGQSSVSHSVHRR